jgi:hypothetical protein
MVLIEEDVNVKRHLAQPFRSSVVAAFGITFFVSRLAAADPLTLLDPFPNQGGTRITEFSGTILNPNVGSGVSWIFDFELPFSGSDGFGRVSGDAIAWGSIDTVAGYINADLANANGFAHTSSVYTLDLPTGVDLSVANTGRAAAALSVWGPAPGGVPQFQNPGYYGSILWEVQSAFESWEVERWTWGAVGDPPTQTNLATGNDLSTFDWSALASYVSDIANGRPIGYFEVIVDTSHQGVPANSAEHARLSFAAVPEPSIWFLLAQGAAFVLGRRLRFAG